MVFLSTFLIDVSADVVLTTVDLSIEQTLALYGTSIPATYYNGSTWSVCEFSYFQSSLEVVDALSSVPAGTKTVIADDWDWRSYPTGFASKFDYIDSMIVGLPRLYYRCPASSVPGISNGSLQFSLTPSIDISNIAYFRQNLNMSVTGTNSFYDYPYNSEFTVASSFSYSDAPVVSYGLGWDGKAYNRFKTSILQDFGGGRETWFSTVDIFGYHVDENGNDSVFSVGNQVFSLSHCAPVTLDNVDYYIIAVSCPRLSADYVLPSPDPEEPNISGQLSDISDSVNVTNESLALILAKLYQIYAVSIAPTVNISSSSSSGIVSGIVNGIKGLFLPSQTDILNFRLQLYNELHALVPAMFSADTAISDVYDSFHDVQPVSSIVFPGVSLNLPDIDGSTVNFSIAAQSVDLKPESGRLSVLYDALALIVDLIATISFFNMLRNKFQQLMESG